MRFSVRWRVIRCVKGRKNLFSCRKTAFLRIFGSVYTQGQSFQGHCRRFCAVFFRGVCENFRYFPTHPPTSAVMFLGVVSNLNRTLKTSKFTIGRDFHSAMGTEDHRFSTCVKTDGLSRFREGKHTGAVFSNAV